SAAPLLTCSRQSGNRARAWAGKKAAAIRREFESESARSPCYFCTALRSIPAAKPAEHFTKARSLTVWSDAATSLLRLGSWCGIARNQPHRPLHHLKPHFLKIRTFPDGLNVAEAIVEHAS